MRIAVVLVGVLLTAGRVDATPDDPLADLRCVRLQVLLYSETSKYSSASEIRRVEDALLVAVRSKLPLLRVADDCPATLLFNYGVHPAMSSADPAIVLGEYGVAVLRLFRWAALVPTGQAHFVSVWGAVSPLIGPATEGPMRLDRKVDASVKDFAASYYRAGNR